MKPKTSRINLLVSLSYAILQPLNAGEEPAQIVIPETAPSSQGDWEISLTPYLWMAGVDGVVGVGEMLAPVDMNFGDVLGNLDFALIGAAEARRGRSQERPLGIPHQPHVVKTLG